MKKGFICDVGSMQRIRGGTRGVAPCYSLSSVILAIAVLNETAAGRMLILESPVIFTVDSDQC